MYNISLIYNYTVANKTEEDEVLSAWKMAGRPLELLPHFEVKEIKRQSRQAVEIKIDARFYLALPTSGSEA